MTTDPTALTVYPKPRGATGVAPATRRETKAVTDDLDTAEHAEPITDTTPAVMTVEDLAAYLQVSPKSVYKLTTAGDLPAARVAGQWRFFKPVIDRWLKVLSLKDYAGPPLGDFTDDEGAADHGEL